MHELVIARGFGSSSILQCAKPRAGAAHAAAATVLQAASRGRASQESVIGGGGGLAGAARRASGQRLLSLQQKLKVATLLQQNRRMGARRVESHKISKLVEEYARFTKNARAPCRRRRSTADSTCGRGALRTIRAKPRPAAVRCDLLPSTSTARSWEGIELSSLAQMGVSNFDHQKMIVRAVRDLREGYDRKGRAAHAHMQEAMLNPKAKRRRRARPAARRRAAARAGAAARAAPALPRGAGRRPSPWGSRRAAARAVAAGGAVAARASHRRQLAARRGDAPRGGRAGELPPPPDSPRPPGPGDAVRAGTARPRMARRACPTRRRCRFRWREG